MHIMEDWEGDVNVADKYFCSTRLCSTSDIMSKVTWNMLDTSNLPGLWICKPVCNLIFTCMRRSLT
jgi:hypothetical protein